MIDGKVRFETPHKAREMLSDATIPENQRQTYQRFQEHIAYCSYGKKNISACQTDRRGNSEIEYALNDAEDVCALERLCKQIHIREIRDRRTENSAENHIGQYMTGVAEGPDCIIIGDLRIKIVQQEPRSAELAAFGELSDDRRSAAVRSKL